MDTASTDIFPQIIIAVLITAAIFFIYLVMEQLYKAYVSYGSSRIAVYPYTGSSGKTIIFQQDPSNPANKTLNLSDNQLTGIEFSYSTFLYISDDTDDPAGGIGWKSIFYKGYEQSPFPLCGPGLFVSNSTSNSTGPTLRVVMNTYDTWFNTLDIAQIPFNKWFHLALVLRGSSLEAYVNGNLANRLSLKGTLPYQNYQPLILSPNFKTAVIQDFDNSTGTTTKRGIPAGDNFVIKGKFSGYISNVTYYTYAISYSEIQTQLNIGPSSEFDQGSMDKPPYLIDTWWTSRAT